MRTRSTLLASAVLLGACASSVDTQVGLIYDSSKHAPDLSYNTVTNPYTDNVPMSANAAAVRWLNDTEMFIDLSGGSEFNASLVYFLNKLRDEGARVDTTFPIAGKVYRGQSMPQRLSAYDMLKLVCDRMNLGYVATYDTRGRPVIRIHERQGADALKPSQLRPAGVLESIQVHYEEPLLSITQRLAAEKGYDAVMFEFRSGVDSPVNMPAQFSGILQGNGLSGLLGQLQEKFAKSVPGIRFFEARGKNGYTLVVTDRPFKYWQELHVFDVESTTLSDNAHKLAAYYGWNANAETSWRLDQDFQIIAPFRIVVTDVQQAYQRLFESYPVEANLVGSTQSVYFVSRPMPVARAGGSR